jgi:hypothetical protein
MTIQYLQKTTHAAVLDECSSWIERTLVGAAETVAAMRKSSARHAQFGHLSKLSPRQLSDIGLDDPQVQMRMFDAYIESKSDYLECLRNQFQVRR